MKVRCVRVNPEEFPIAEEHKTLFRARLGKGTPKAFSSVELSREYVVYAVRLSAGFPDYYVSYRDRVDDWMFVPGPCFEVIDHRVSKFWHIGVELAERSGLPIVTMAIRQWIEDPMFFQNVVDCKEREVRIMIEAAAAMNAEYL